MASIVLVVFLVSSNTLAATGINEQISFQGKVVNNDGTNTANASYTFLFCLYTTASPATPCTSGANNDAVWRESKSLSTTDGIFQTNLGDTTTLPGSVDFNTDNIYLGINFNADGQMSPLVRFTAAPYALNAAKVSGLTVTDTTGTLTIPSGKTISFADAFATSGAFATTLTATGTTNVTLPTTGTLATLAGAEAFTNKTNYNGLVVTANTGVITTGTWNGTDIAVLDGGTGTSTGSITGTTALTFAAGGTAQNVNLTPSTTGAVVVASSTANADTIKLLPQSSGVAATFAGILTTADLTVSDKTYTFPNSSITVNAAADISGTTLASNVITSSLTTVGTLGTLTVDDITLNANTISSAGASSLSITPTTGQAILLDGTISVDAGVVTGITSLGVTGTRVTAGFFTDLTVTNAIAGSVTGNAGTVTGFTPASGSLTLAGADALTLTTTADSNVTLPTTGTLATLAGSETLSTKTLTAPKFVDLGFIADANGNEILVFDTVATAVPYLQLSNNSTGLNPVITGAGEANTGIDFAASGTGTFRFTGNASQAGEIRLFEDTDNGTNFTAFKVGIQAGDVTYTLPTAYPAVTGYVLSATDAGVMSWVSAGGAQTPWSSDISAAGFDLGSLSNLGFQETTGAPTGTDVGFYRDNTGDLTGNVLTGKTFNLAVNGSDEYNFSSTGLAMNSNSITGLGTNLTAAADLTVASTTTGLTLDSGSNTLTIAASDTALSATGVTTLTLGAASSIVQNGAAALTIGNSSTTQLSLTTDNNAANDINITGGTTFNDEVTLTLAGTEFLSVANTTQGTSDLVTFAPTWTADNTGDALQITTTYNVNASIGTQYGLNLVNADNTTSTSAIDALALFSNDQATETVADGIIVRHNVSSGTLTDAFQIENTTAGGTITNAINITETAGTITTGINIGNNITTGITIGTGVTTGISVGSGGISITAGALAVNSDSITSDGTLVINASGTVDVDDILNANSITSDAGVSIAAGSSYTGAGAVILSSAAGANNLTIDSGTTGSVLIGTGVAAKVITIGNAADDTFSLNSSGLNVTSGGALTGVASIDTIAVSATAITFAGTGTITSTTTGLTLDSGSGRLTVATGDFLSLGVSGVAGAAAGDIWYDTAASKFKINEAGVTKTLCNETNAGCGAGGSSDLQTTYGNDADGTNATISLTAADDGLIFTNPTSGGNNLSAFLLQLDQAHTTDAVKALDIVQASNAANAVNITANVIDAETGLAITTNGLTSGSGLTVASSSITMTGSLAGITLSGSDAANTGNALAVSNTGVLNTGTSLLVQHNATGTNNLAVRVNDVAGDTTPFVIDGAGNVGVGTDAPARAMDIVQAASAPQLRLSKDLTNYSEMTVDSAGDLLIGATGTDIRALSENVWVCDGDACPALTLTGDGNIFVENVIKFGNGVYLKNDSATELTVYDNDDQAMLIFDEL